MRDHKQEARRDRRHAVETTLRLTFEGWQTILNQSVSELFARAFNDADTAYGRTGAAFLPHFAQLLVERSGLRPGQAVLDLATGPGTVALPAAGTVGVDGSVVGVDVAERQLQIARSVVGEREAAVRFVRDDATALDLPEGSMDVALCGFGLPYIQEPVRLFREAARVVRGGGVVAATLWAQNFLAPAGDHLQALMERHEVALLHRPFGDEPSEIAQSMLRADLHEVEIEEHTLDVIFPSFEVWWEMCRAFAFLARLSAVDAETRQAVMAEHRADSAVVQPDGTVPMRVRVYLARGVV